MHQPKIVPAAAKVLNVLKALKGHSLDGISNDALCKQLNMPPSGVTRAVETLISTGWATRLDNGRFAPSIAALQFAEAYAREMDSAVGRINEIRQRVAAGAR
ncbi:MAG TPA: helix-turn-helix domain-containing protein [Fluviicoccus sp.]|nr:helix-turn-helix domain-containing protein [Fluviicoccus sp.]